jgi:hypothetical protein
LVRETRPARGVAALQPLAFGALAVLATGCGEAADASEIPDDGSRGAASLWGGEHRLEAPDSAEIDQFGYAVALAEGRALVGAYGETLYQGAAYVFAREGDGWLEEQKLFPGEGVEGDSFGWSVSLGAERLLIGAPARASQRGAAYVFVRDGDSWLEEQVLAASDGMEGDQFGWSVSLFEDRALVGAFSRGGSRGASYLFHLTDGVWLEEQVLVANDGAESDLFGYAVALSASGALIGAPGNESAKGAAYLFTPGDTSWQIRAKLTADHGVEDGYLGISVSLAAGRALVGASSDESLRGAAYVFADSDGSFREEQKLAASDGAPGHRFGNALALGVDRALVGAYASDDSRGAAYAFAFSDGSWSERQKLVASDGISSDFFGWSVAMDADHVILGAHYDDVLRGAAYVYSLGLGQGEGCSADDACASGYCVDRRCSDGPRAVPSGGS